MLSYNDALDTIEAWAKKHGEVHYGYGPMYGHFDHREDMGVCIERYRLLNFIMHLREHLGGEEDGTD